MSTKPIVTRDVAPARRLPGWESFGSTEFELVFPCFPEVDKPGVGEATKIDVRARAERTCVSVVMYMATPGTFLYGAWCERVFLERRYAMLFNIMTVDLRDWEKIDYF